MSKTTIKFFPEVRQRAVRLVLDHEHSSRRATINPIAPKTGCTMVLRDQAGLEADLLGERGFFGELVEQPGRVRAAIRGGKAPGELALFRGPRCIARFHADGCPPQVDTPHAA